MIFRGRQFAQLTEIGVEANGEREVRLLRPATATQPAAASAPRSGSFRTARCDWVASEPVQLPGLLACDRTVRCLPRLLSLSCWSRYLICTTMRERLITVSLSSSRHPRRS